MAFNYRPWKFLNITCRMGIIVVESLDSLSDDEFRFVETSRLKEMYTHCCAAKKHCKPIIHSSNLTRDDAVGNKPLLNQNSVLESASIE